MSYILDGSGIDSPECRQLQIQSVNNIERESGVYGTLLFDAVDAFIENDGPENHYRPYLTIMGRPVGIQADLPYNISTLRYQSSHDKKLVAYRYDFTRENLSRMAMKGLFEDGFRPSKLARTSQYELPCEVSYVAFPPVAQHIDPETGAQLPPVIFASLQPGSLHCNDYESGYTIDDYFEPAPDKSAENELQDGDYELPVEARILGDEFSFATQAPEAQNAPDLADDTQMGYESQDDVGVPEMPVSEPDSDGLDDGYAGQPEFEPDAPGVLGAEPMPVVEEVDGAMQVGLPDMSVESDESAKKKRRTRAQSQAIQEDVHTDVQSGSAPKQHNVSDMTVRDDSGDTEKEFF